MARLNRNRRDNNIWWSTSQLINMRSRWYFLYSRLSFCISTSRVEPLLNAGKLYRVRVNDIFSVYGRVWIAIRRRWDAIYEYLPRFHTKCYKKRIYDLVRL